MVSFDNSFGAWSLRSNSVTRQVYDKTKSETFLVNFKHRASSHFDTPSLRTRTKIVDFMEIERKYGKCSGPSS